MSLDAGRGDHYRTENRGMAVRMNQKFDEPNLLRRLEQLAEPLRVAFAAAFAERLFPGYIAYSERYDLGEPGTLRGALDGAWRVACGGALGFDPDEAFERCAALAPTDDDPGHHGTEYANDAAASVAYAVQATKAGCLEQAALAARRAYEAIDQFVINRENIDLSLAGAEERVLAHPLVQAEFSRQDRDLDDLVGVSDADVGRLALRLRDRARAEGTIFFDAIK